MNSIRVDVMVSHFSLELCAVWACFNSVMFGFLEGWNGFGWPVTGSLGGGQIAVLGKTTGRAGAGRCPPSR